MNVSDYLPFLNLVTWNTFHFVAALTLFLFCIWLGWDIRRGHMGIYLLIAVVFYVPALLLWHSQHMPLIILGGLVCSIVTVSIPGILLGKYAHIVDKKCCGKMLIDCSYPKPI